MPDLARRGRTTLRHFVLLLFGAYSEWIESRRRRGARGVVFRMQAITAWVSA